MAFRSSATPSRQTADPAGKTTDPAGQTAEPTDAAPAQQHAREQARVPERATSATAAQSAPAPAQQHAREQARVPERATSATAAQSAPAPGRPDGRPHITVRTTADPGRQLPVVERALRTSPGIQGDGWHERVVMVPGGHRPGKPDQLQRDQARARFPLPGPARIVVLGCTAGAGQTTTTLLTGQLLATLRGEAVAVLDIGSGAGSLTEQARQIPRLLPGHRDLDGAAPESGRERGLQVVTADPPAEQPADAGNLIDAVVARYRITIADPAAVHVPRAVPVADQLVLVAPASHDAAGSLAMTLEWLEAHGHADLARNSVTVLNGVSTATAAHVERAAGVATGRCRAIVRVPWDGGLANGRALGPAAVHAFTALAGVLISGLADPANARGAADPAHPHGARAESGQR